MCKDCRRAQDRERHGVRMCVDCGTVPLRTADPRCPNCRVAAELKMCPECGEVKPVGEFHKNSATVDKLYRVCRPCTRDEHHRLTYNMAAGEYDARLRRQGGVCAICGAAPDGGNLNVDHCHVTDVVRGLLCWNCNQAIGRLGDTSEGVMRAVRYLRAAEAMIDAAPERTRR